MSGMCITGFEGFHMSGRQTACGFFFSAFTFLSWGIPTVPPLLVALDSSKIGRDHTIDEMSLSCLSTNKLMGNTIIMVVVFLHVKRQVKLALLHLHREM